MSKLHTNMAKRDFIIDFVPKTISYYKGQYFSTYGKDPQSKYPYRSLEDLKEYVDGIGTAEIQYVE
jgi:hypothetical protein